MEGDIFITLKPYPSTYQKVTRQRFGYLVGYLVRYPYPFKYEVIYSNNLMSKVFKLLSLFQNQNIHLNIKFLDKIQVI